MKRGRYCGHGMLVGALPRIGGRSDQDRQQGQGWADASHHLRTRFPVSSLKAKKAADGSVKLTRCSGFPSHERLALRSGDSDPANRNFPFTARAQYAAGRSRRSA
ncbi:MAG: hypothetical protein ACM3YM_05635 [Sphingomonadales bacterium]